MTAKYLLTGAKVGQSDSSPVGVGKYVSVSSYTGGSVSSSSVGMGVGSGVIGFLDGNGVGSGVTSSVSFSVGEGLG